MNIKLKYLFRRSLAYKKLKKIFVNNLQANKDIKYWRSIKDKHKGRAGFIIGNGPSLKMEDLSRIWDHKFISIASNKIYLAFDQTNWRPDYYTIADPLVWNKINSEIPKEIKIVHAPASYDNEFCNVKVKKWKNITNDFERDLKNISDDISRGIAGGYTVTYENIQIALHLGLNPIYLIGCDHYYGGEENVISGQIVEQTKIQNHFIKNYRKEGEKVFVAAIQKMTQAYEIARLYSDENGVEIYNATRGGHLEVFPRIDIDEILGNY